MRKGKLFLRCFLLSALSLFILSDNSYSQTLLPDLTVSEIKLIEECKIQVTIKNIGSAGLPDIAYDRTRGVAIQMYKDGKPWGGIRLFGFDPYKKLMNPGASVSWVWFPLAENLKLGSGTHTIRVVVDMYNIVKESNEDNNERTEKLLCEAGAKLPDLIVSDIRFISESRQIGNEVVKDCGLQVTIRNIGSVGLPDSAYGRDTGIGFQIWIDGEIRGGLGLYAADPSKLLKNPGTSVTFSWGPGQDKPIIGFGVHTVEVIIVDIGDVVKESNETNNSKKVSLTCSRPLI